MPTKRRCTTAVCAKTVLIVIRGARNTRVLKTVKVMNIATGEWYTAADIPEGVFSVSATLCGGRVYILGGKTGFNEPGLPGSVYACSLSDLIESCSSKHTTPTSSTLMKDTVWSKLADLPVELSTSLSFRGHLLAVGGEQQSAPSKDIYLYNPTANSWSVTGHMSVPRCKCLAFVLDNRELVIVGGYDLDSVEIMTT